jgi:gas vesicle protein
MCNRCHKEKSRFLLGAIIGGAVCGIAALLYAPKEGRKIRKDLCNGCDDIRRKAIDAEHDIEDVAGEFTTHTKKLAKKLMKRLSRYY